MPKPRTCNHVDIVTIIRKSGPAKGRKSYWCRTCTSLRNKAKTSDVHHKYNIRKYGIDDRDYALLLEQQDGLCAICRRPETVMHKGKLLRLAVDHNHTTKTARGLLCCACNRALGLFQDSVLVLEAAISYRGQYV